MGNLIYKQLVLSVFVDVHGVFVGVLGVLVGVLGVLCQIKSIDYSRTKNRMTQRLWVIIKSMWVTLFINSLYLYLSGLSLKRTKHVAKVSITNEFLPN